MNRVHRLLDALGPAGVAGLGVLVFCAALHFSALLPAERELAARVLALERQRAHAGVRPVSGVEGASELLRFHAAFPPASRLADELAELSAQAKAAKLELEQAEYRLDARGTGLAAYRVVLPVRGSYAQVRRFVGLVLERMPTASVDALRFERGKTTDARLEARVQLTLYLRVENDAKGI